jgi:hypothetical protein
MVSFLIETLNKVRNLWGKKYMTSFVAVSLKTSKISEIGTFYFHEKLIMIASTRYCGRQEVSKKDFFF